MNCCFCGKELKRYGNSTWPIYPDEIPEGADYPSGEQMRCCDSCNQKFVIPARINPTCIMSIRELFGIHLC